MKRNNLAYREAFLAGRLGIRAKILIYLAVLAGFIISAVWMLQGMLVFSASKGLNVPPQLLSAVVPATSAPAIINMLNIFFLIISKFSIFNL